MRQLVAAILDDPVAALQGRSSAADKLVAMGAPALPLVREVLNGNWASDAHPKDVSEAFALIAQRIAAGAETRVTQQPPNER